MTLRNMSKSENQLIVWMQQMHRSENEPSFYRFHGSEQCNNNLSNSYSKTQNNNLTKLIDHL